MKVVAELFRSLPKATNGADDRAELRQALTAFAQAREAAQRAAQAVERAQAAVTRAHDALAACGPVNDDVAAFRAAEVRSGTTAGPLSNVLVARRQRQQRAEIEAADAERTFALLDGEATTARAAADLAEVELKRCVDAAMQVSACAVIARMRTRELEVAADRLLIGAFLAIRPMNAPRVAWEIEATMMEPINRPALVIAEAAHLPPGEPVWRDLQARLLVDAGAVLGQGE